MDGPKKNGSLPDPELNPMLNPTLGKNLGRWAQVYFTSPPEKREEAVQELLKELESGGTGDIAVQVSSAPAPSETKDDFGQKDDVGDEDDFAQKDDFGQKNNFGQGNNFAREKETVLPGFNSVAPRQAEPEEDEREVASPKPAFERAEVSYRQSKELFPDEIEKRDVAFEAEERPDGEVCPACLHKNEARQRFCGFCGFALHSEINAPAPAAAATRPVSRSPVAPPLRPQQAPVRPASLHTDERDAETWQWLHEKNLAKLATARERKRRWTVPLVVVLLLAMGAGYLYWRSTTGEVGVATPAAGKQQAQDNQAEEQKNSGPTSKVPGLAKRDGTRPQSEPRSTQRTVPPPASRSETASARVPPPRVVPKAAPPPARSETEAVSSSLFQEGLQELTMGRRYLSGEGVPRDHATAAKWLWKSVGKQNPEAVLLLSDLYVRGDGVPQSCDQARILLTAAAKRSSPGAADKLRSVLAVCR